MLEFTKLSQDYPDRRAPDERAKDFKEIYQPFAVERALAQASRCSQCGIPFCQVHCPLHNNIPDWLRLAAEDRLDSAYEVVSLTNSFPEICGRICPQDRLCEGNCVIEQGFGSVTIGAVEKHITETAWKRGWVKPFVPKSENGLSVGIIGAGPAGLAAGEQLRRLGYEVHVYDRYDRVGGLLVYGIPNFKLDKAVVERRTQQFTESGILFHVNCAVGDDVAFEELQQRHSALLVATGVYTVRDLPITNHTLTGIVPALDYLITSNKVGLGDSVDAYENGQLNAKGKRVVVIGGGDTAMDCVRTAIRQQAESVTCLYRRDRENMPGSAREVLSAEEEGVEFRWLSSPKAFLGDEALQGIVVQPMRLGVADASGRQKPEPVPDNDYKLEADLVVLALGFEPEDLPIMFKQPGLVVSEHGTLKVGADWMTSLPGVFAAGDIVRGASLVVWGIHDGREAAAHMHRYIHQQREHVA